MDRVIFLFFFTLIYILLDFYFFQIFKRYITNKWFKILNYIYWSISSITFLNFVFNIIDINLGYFIKTLIFNIVIGNFISKVVALPFLLIDDLRRFSKRLFFRKSISKENTIPRSKFLSISASLAYGIPITSLTYGIISNNVCWFTSSGRWCSPCLITARVWAAFRDRLRGDGVLGTVFPQKESVKCQVSSVTWANNVAYATRHWRIRQRCFHVFGFALPAPRFWPDQYH